MRMKSEDETCWTEKDVFLPDPNVRTLKLWHCPGTFCKTLALPHMYAGNYKRIHLSHELISYYAMKARRIFNGDFLSEKLYRYWDSNP